MTSKAFLFFIFALSFIILLVHAQTAASFDFLHKLKGIKKGDQVKGVPYIKKYLQYYGYLNYPAGFENHANDDDFDAHLEDALRIYQANFHLNTSGTLDDDTISSISRPRCGVPDIINGTNWMQSHKHNHVNNMFHPDYSFLTGSPKWPHWKTHLTYGFDYSVPALYEKQIAIAFTMWGAATRFSFSEADYDYADIKIQFASGDHGDHLPFDGTTDNIAHGFAPTDGRIHFSADTWWSIGAVPMHFDVGTVARHEIGHVLGLGHSDIHFAIMYPGAHYCFVNAHLSYDDINGIKALYED